ncbi:MAG TPA: LysE family translocator [Gaiellales bacterium]|jgi:threonine/homoserine/homoserine lactone efflux protein|nr:LysE family translocator [Gaiellales bacterium]
MPNLATWLAFVATALVLLLIPGPAVLYIVSQSVEHGRRAGLMATLGVHCGTLVHITAAALGLSAILVSSSIAFGAVRLVGAAYLIYLGVRTLADRTARAQAPAPRETRLGLIFRQGILVNVTNPKTALFFFAFLPQFVNRNGAPIPEQIVVLGLTFAVLGLITDGAWAVAAGSAAGWVKGRSTVRSLQRWVTGCIFIGLGVATALVGSEKR